MVGHTGIKNIRPENGKSSALKRPIQRRSGYIKQKVEKKGPVEDSLCKLYINIDNEHLYNEY
jgi:hypothetical protein